MKRKQSRKQNDVGFSQFAFGVYVRAFVFVNVDIKENGRENKIEKLNNQYASTQLRISDTEVYYIIKI